jgi:two-component system, OmpR family, response regulator MprA
MRILIADDEPAVRESLARALQLEGYQVDLAADGQAAVDQAHRRGMDGLDVCRSLRDEGLRLPILILTAREEVTDRVAGLDAGADDYLTKPFALDELLARLRALLRRLGDGGELRFADVVLDPKTHSMRRAEREIDLTKTEFLLMELFLRNPRQVLPRSLIFERVWGYDFGYGTNSLDVYIGYLRRKLEVDGGSRLVHTKRGVGYMLRES